jgi:ABC-2 type transport system ATP-binding protein
MNVLKVKQLEKKFGTNQALAGISFGIEKGEIFGFLGPNGAGKSTTMRCIMDYIQPSAGQVTIFGKDSRLKSAELKQRIGYVPSESNLYGNWTADEHIAFCGRLKIIDKSRAEELKQLLQLDGQKKVRQLSTGNQQKLAIILGLIHKPDLLLLDEPTRGLDPLLRSMMHNLLRTYQKDGGTVLLSSHDLSEVEELCSNLAIIRAGKIVTDSSVDKLRQANIHSIKIRFDGKLPDLSSLGLEELVTSDQTVNFKLKGDINPILKALAGYSVGDLEVTKASLDDVFMEIYK